MNSENYKKIMEASSRCLNESETDCYLNFKVQNYTDLLTYSAHIYKAIELMSDSNNTVKGEEHKTLFSIRILAELGARMLPFNAVEFVDNFIELAKEDKDTSTDLKKAV